MGTDEYYQHKIVIRNLINLLLLIFIPLLTLSSLSVIVTQRYIKEEVNKNNIILLKQASQKIDLILNKMDTLSLNFGINPYMIIELDHLFNQPALTYEDLQILSVVKSNIDSAPDMSSYIKSVYLYYKNSNNRLISSDGLGLTNINSYYDKEWYNTFQNNQEKTKIYSELRKFNDSSYAPGQSILSIYKNLFTTNGKKANGVIVMNIQTDFMQELLKSLISYPNEGIVVMNENQIPVISYQLPSKITNQELMNFLSDNRLYFTYSLSGKSYTVSKYYSSNYGWTYLSVTPNDSLYVIPMRLLQLTVVLLVISLVMGILLALYVTRKNQMSFIKIVEMLDAAKEGRPLPVITSRIKDEHSYIIENIVKTFINQEYLKMQLSERKYRMKVLELQALQSQINPHFLYNTLHTISWKAISLTKKPNEISNMIDNLSTILKYVLSSSDEMITLDKEIYYTMCYVNIQSVRYSNKFKFRLVYDEQLANIKIMKLLLQPLIENSIYHGIKEKEGAGTITIRIGKSYSQLKILIADNGLGMKEERLQEIRKRLMIEEKVITDHIGLYNVNKRLQLTYGDNFTLRIKSAFQKGTAILIRIPVSQTDNTYE